MRENRKNVTRISADKAYRLNDETDDARLDAMTDAGIAKAVAEDPDAPPLKHDWTQARLSLPPRRDIVTLRLDRDVLDWFRAQGKGYQTRINQALRAFYEARRDQLAADAVEGVKTSGRGSNARVEQAPGEAGAGAREQRQASRKKAYAAEKRRAAKQAAKVTVAKRRA
jgi:uncharacterized protein (DUF4415 family)